jgi:cytochrome c-type biogenesis protein CcmH
MVRTHLAALEGVGPETAKAGAVAPGPASKPAEAAAIASLAPDQQQAMIRGMVAKLAARLAQTGGGVDDWERLVRAYAVLREPEKARAALIDARRKLSGDGAAQSSLSALAHELGLEG